MEQVHYRRRPLYRAYLNGQRPMSEINTTPLIDVLLVLLIMLILAVPITPHRLEVDLPAPSDVPVTSASQQIALSIDAGGQIFWQGTAVTSQQLQSYLNRAATLPDAPVIRFHPDPQASYDATVQVIAQVADAGLDNFAFIGNEQFSGFGKD
jgi:biopolymer transport protein ExbD